MSGDGATVGLILGGAVMALIILVAVFHCRGKRKEENELFKARAAARIALIKGSAHSGASRPTGVTQGKKPGTGDNFSNRHNTMPQKPAAQKGEAESDFSLAGPFPVASTSVFPTVQPSTFSSTGVSHGGSTSTTSKGKGNNYSNRHNTMPPQHPLPNAGSTPHNPVTAQYPATTTILPAVQQSIFPLSGVPQGSSTGTGKGKGNNYSNRHNTMPPQHPLPNAGFAPHISATGQYPATTFPGSHQSMTPTTVIPMTPITSLPMQPQQIHTFQDHMQALQFSSHPRPTFVTTAYSTEPGTSNVPVSYPGSSGAPQAAWQPTPFVPPARPASNTGLPSHSAGAEAGVVGHSPGASNATEFSSTTGIDTSQTNAVRDPNDSGTPSPASPPPSPFVPRSTRPNQEPGSALSPHALLARSQNPQYVDEYHLH
ncbi:hypothetical protein BKA57DRAFT_458896 [Linnemannia elongata]|nr:hypothetical protein BKA57DRAFT_458896 [Linnemannia elongata]